MWKMAMEKTISFYHVHRPYGFFSNFAPYSIVLKGKIWPTSEHYFQAQKFCGTKYEEEVRCACDPKKAARIGRERRFPLRKDWELVKNAVMKEALLAKFTQHDELREKLIATGTTLLIEHTKNDSYWGDGGDSSGKNILGIILMEIRSELIKQAVL